MQRDSLCFCQQQRKKKDDLFRVPIRSIQLHILEKEIHTEAFQFISLLLNDDITPSIHHLLAPLR
jgi:hypothetical protein